MADIPILSSIFGTKPEIAPFTNLNLDREQMLALQGDLAAWGDISQLGDLFQQNYLSQLETAIPGFRDILAQGGALTAQEEGIAKTELAGQVPPDVAAQVTRSAAFQSLLSGTTGGPMAGALSARDLGLTSLDLINQGANMAGQAGNAAQRWASLSGAGQAAGVEQSMLQTPQQRSQFDLQQALIQQAIQQARNNVAAAPDPIAKGLSDIVENLTAAYLGGKVGSIGAGNAAATQATSTNYAFGTPASSAGVPYTPAGTGVPSSIDPNYDQYGVPISNYGGGGGGGGGGVGGSSLPMGPNTGAFTGDLYNQSPYLSGNYNPFGFAGGLNYASPQYASANPYLTNPFTFN
jgi:hypothetical protein